MSQPRTAFARLSEELRNIEVFDRIHEYASLSDPANERLHARRQVRRSEILEEIESLKAYKPSPWKPAELTGAIAVICAVGYAMVYYSLK